MHENQYACIDKNIQHTLYTKGRRQDGMGVEGVSVAEALSHADTIEISCHSPIRVLLPDLESIKSNRHTSYRSYSTNADVQNH